MNRRNFAAQLMGMGLTSNLIFRDAWAENLARTKRVFDLHIEPTWSPDGKEIILVSNPRSWEVFYARSCQRWLLQLKLENFPGSGHATFMCSKSNSSADPLSFP